MISEQEVRVTRALQQSAPEWLTSREVAQRARVAPRTSRHHLGRLAELRVVEVAEVHPGPRYRLVDQQTREGREYLERVDEAAETMTRSGGDQ